jgi:hypothetical protein
VTKAAAGLRLAWAGALALVLAAIPGEPLSGQSLADYDYDQLTFRGVAFEAGWIFPDRVEDTEQFGMRFDLGYLGPGIRLTPRIGWFSSRMTDREVARLETRVAELVFDQNPLSPLPEVDLGVVDWSVFSVGLDAHFVWRVPFGLLTYMGGGVAAHFQNGSGDVVDGTFIEDLLDSPVAGVNAQAGIEYPVSDVIRVYGDLRYEIAGDLRFPAFRVGLAFMTGSPAPGEMEGR